MIIQVDKEGENVIQQLCDIALKMGGIQNLRQINNVLKSIILIPEATKQEDFTKQENKEDNK